MMFWSVFFHQMLYAIFVSSAYLHVYYNRRMLSSVYNIIHSQQVCFQCIVIDIFFFGEYSEFSLLISIFFFIIWNYATFDPQRCLSKFLLTSSYMCMRSLPYLLCQMLTFFDRIIFSKISLKFSAVVSQDCILHIFG